MDDKEYISSLVGKAKAAQSYFGKNFDQTQVDDIVKSIAKIVFDRAEEFARLAVEETRMGDYASKVKKKKGKSRILWYSLQNKKSMGIISRDEKTGIVEIAKPVGVVGAVQPCTNPIVTPMANAMAALKGKNAIIIAAHPRAQQCTNYAVDLWRKAVAAHGAPEDIIQSVESVSVERTNLLMKMVDVVVATGGPGMVKAAYSSGKPSFGVGAGNVQCVLDREIDVKEALKKVIEGRTFDNGIICSGEQSIIVPYEMVNEVKRELLNQRCAIIEDSQEKERLVSTLFPLGTTNKDLVGQPVSTIAEAARLELEKDIVLIVVPEDVRNKKSELRREKMFPVMAFFSYNTFDEALEIVQDNLNLEGKGHSVCIHSNNKEHIEKLGLSATVSRVIVNAPCATTSGGSFMNGLPATSTLGCGSWGNNSISENFTYRHLLNITRIAYPISDVQIPSDDELFG